MVPIATVYASNSSGEDAAATSVYTSGDCTGYDRSLSISNLPNNVGGTKTVSGANPITVTITDTLTYGAPGSGSGYITSPTEFSFLASIGVGRVVVKSQIYQSTYNYSTPTKSGSGLDQDNHVIKTIVFCWDDPPKYATASAVVGSCGEGSFSSPVTFSSDGASMSVNGPDGYSTRLRYGPSTLSNLQPGDYSLSYTMRGDYTDPGTLPTGFTIVLCPPSLEDATASASVGSCAEGLLSEPVTLSITGATMHVWGSGCSPHDVVNTTEIIDGLTPGSYTLTYDTPVDGYKMPDDGLPGPGGFTIGACEPPKQDMVAVVNLGCELGHDSQSVYLSVTGGVMTISGGPGDYYNNTIDNTFIALDDLKEGTYNLSYSPDALFVNPGNLESSFTIGECTRYFADASALIEACGVADETEPVTLFVSHAIMHIEGPAPYTYSIDNDTETIDGLAAGFYGIQYTLEEGYEDPGDLPARIHRWRL